MFRWLVLSGFCALGGVTILVYLLRENLTDDAYTDVRFPPQQIYLNRYAPADLPKAAEAGAPAAQFEYGLELLAEDDVDKAAAFHWVRSAADNGLAVAENEIGVAYEKGFYGYAEDPAEARIWFRRSAEGGDELGAYNLARLLQEERGGRRDDAEAARWYLVSARRGCAASQFAVFLIWREGAGVARNMGLAERARIAARAQGYDAFKWVDDVYRDFGAESGDAGFLVPHNSRRSSLGLARALRCAARRGRILEFPDDARERPLTIGERKVLLSGGAKLGDPYAQEDFSAFWTERALEASVFDRGDASGNVAPGEAPNAPNFSIEADYWCRRAAANPLRNSTVAGCDGDFGKPTFAERLFGDSTFFGL